MYICSYALDSKNIPYFRDYYYKFCLFWHNFLLSINFFCLIYYNFFPSKSTNKKGNYLYTIGEPRRKRREFGHLIFSFGE